VVKVSVFYPNSAGCIADPQPRFKSGVFWIKNREKIYWGHDELQDNRWLSSAGGSFLLE
jgi:hypothetical protein